jgi:DDE superfamily endonuclease
LKPENSKELFNLRHASLRDVIERIFGVLKRRYQILRSPSECSMDTQTRVRVILACTGLHNWVRSIEGSSADILPEKEKKKTEESEDIQPEVAYIP